MKDYTPEDLTWEMTINSDSGKAHAMMVLEAMFKEHSYLDIEIVAGKQRTHQQQKALEVYFRELAKDLNGGGFDQRKVFEAMKDGVEIPNTQKSIKELWKIVQEAVLGTNSTTKLSRENLTRVYDVFNRWTAEKFGVSRLFPHKDDAND